MQQVNYLIQGTNYRKDNQMQSLKYKIMRVGDLYHCLDMSILFASFEKRSHTLLFQFRRVLISIETFLGFILCLDRFHGEELDLGGGGALWTSNGKKGSVKWRCENAQSRGFLGNFVNLHNATS